MCFFQGEGVAFRGRALVELQTVLGETPEVAVEDMPHDYRIDVSTSALRNKLFCWLLNLSFKKVEDTTR